MKSYRIQKTQQRVKEVPTDHKVREMWVGKRVYDGNNARFGTIREIDADGDAWITWYTASGRNTGPYCYNRHTVTTYFYEVTYV